MDIITAIPLTLNYLHKAEMEYHGKFEHTLGRIHHIAIMSRNEIYYIACHMETQTVATDLTGFQYLKLCVQFIAIHPHKPIFYPYTYYYGLNDIILTWSGNKVEDYTTHSFI